jgi:protein-tyrosine phosphatase
MNSVMCDFSEITDHIFIGNVYAVIGDYRNKETDILDILNIKTVISAITEEEYEDYYIGQEDFCNVDWHRLVIDDDPEENISKHFFDVHAAIQRAIDKGHRVIVHCAAGISRSATLVIAYLMIENHWTFQEAFDYVRKRRSIINPNPGFIKQLKGLEFKLRTLTRVFL